MNNKFWTVIVIVISTTLIQYHSMKFWLGITGYIGILWSASIEISMLWLWYENRLTFIRCALILLLLFGPWMQISKPILTTARAKTAAENQIATKREQIKVLKDSLKRYENNSANRTGWAPLINKARQDMEKTNNDINRFMKADESLNSSAISNSIMIIEALILMVTIIIQITAVSKLGTEKQPPAKTSVKRNKRKISYSIAATNKPLIDNEVEITAEQLRLKLQDYGNQKELAANLGTREADISIIFNHDKRMKSGKETISAPALKRINGKLQNI